MSCGKVIRSQLLFSLVAALASSFALGCTGGTETGNPSFDGNLSYTGYSSEPLRVAVGSDASGSSAFVVTNAWLDLDTVTLSANGSCGATGDDLNVAALGIGDHAAGRHNVTSFQTTSGSFCSAALPFTQANGVLPSGAPDALRGGSLLLEGTLPDLTPFSVSSTATPSITLDTTAGFSLDVNQPDLLIAFDFAHWLDGVDATSAIGSDGTVQIDEANHPELLQKVQANLAAGVSLYRDSDGDGKIDPGSLPLAQGR